LNIILAAAAAIASLAKLLAASTSVATKWMSPDIYRVVSGLAVHGDSSVGTVLYIGGAAERPVVIVDRQRHCPVSLSVVLSNFN